VHVKFIQMFHAGRRVLNFNIKYFKNKATTLG
jgi:hypothetical protein